MFATCFIKLKRISSTGFHFFVSLRGLSHFTNVFPNILGTTWIVLFVRGRVMCWCLQRLTEHCKCLIVCRLTQYCVVWFFHSGFSPLHQLNMRWGCKMSNALLNTFSSEDKTEHYTIITCFNNAAILSPCSQWLISLLWVWREQWSQGYCVQC